MPQLYGHNSTAPKTRAATAASKRRRKPRTRYARKTGVAPIPNFDITTLAPSQPLSMEEAAGVLRVSAQTVRLWRKKEGHPLRFTLVAGQWWRVRVGDLLDYMARKTKM